MNDLSLKAILESAAAWPEEDRQELADFARVIEARRAGFYQTDKSERQALSEGLEKLTVARSLDDYSSPNRIDASRNECPLYRTGVRDREEILNYLSSRSQSGARNVLERFEAAAEMIAEQPLIGLPTDIPEVRVLFVGRYPYKFFYRIRKRCGRDPSHPAYAREHGQDGFEGAVLAGRP